MCGIVGFWSKSSVDANVAKLMAASIVHRGPDDSGVWTDVSAGLALGHRRLASAHPETNNWLIFSK